MTGPIGLPLAKVMGYQAPEADLAEAKKREDAFLAELEAAGRAGSRRELATLPESGLGRRPAVATTPAPAVVKTTAGTPTPSANASSAGTPIAANPNSWLPPVKAEFSGSVADFEDPTPKVKELLTQLGINPAEIRFELADDPVTNPLGSGHINHYLRAYLPNGQKGEFAIEYVLRNPKITAHEINAMMKMPQAPPHLYHV